MGGGGGGRHTMFKDDPQKSVGVKKGHSRIILECMKIKWDNRKFSMDCP